MRRIAPLFLASALLVGVGCDTTATIDWIDPCAGSCLADEVCVDDVGGAYCMAASDCAAPYAVCDYSDGSAGCVDLDYDVYNCGGCGVYCDGICSFGTCEGSDYSCESVGLMTCDGYCADPNSDVDCGACGNACAIENGEFCAGGACYGSGSTCEDYSLTTCPDGCADLLTDPYNCGACGVECVMGCDGAGACL